MAGGVLISILVAKRRVAEDAENRRGYAKSNISAYLRVLCASAIKITAKIGTPAFGAVP